MVIVRQILLRERAIIFIRLGDAEFIGLKTARETSAGLLASVNPSPPTVLKFVTA